MFRLLLKCFVMKPGNGMVDNLQGVQLIKASKTGSCVNVRIHSLDIPKQWFRQT